ncbi:chromate transporter [Paenisporosarcina antarctica]|uniref:Chromate transporter n=1 Tax=Paenisporosarcina antarctica TaxID=417367 RepID=A0A4P6ZWI7_9BACL|nr:chromate transporter [Paenisporosarcina antarctica]QBP39846.1 chromate transporter [Paenisporosarcina antarctica]
MVERPISKNTSARPGRVLHRNIGLAFFRIGMLGFGGGPSSIPLVHQEVVKKYEWMTDDEFGDTLALANTLPGPIATKMAGYVGYRVAGLWGCLNALLSSIIPTVVLMIVFLGLLQTYKDVPWVENMAASVVPVVAVMLALLTWEFIKKSGQTLGWMRALLLLALSAILIEAFNIHPAFVILGCFLVAFSSLLKRRKKA